MNYDDFSSLVQLGVGLHLGTALLQEVGAIGVRPLHRTATRLRSLVDNVPEISELTRERLDDLEASLAIFEVRMFKTFRQYFLINAGVGLMLLALLTLIAFKASDSIPEWLAVFMVGLSTLPAIATVVAFGVDSSSEYRPLKRSADQLEDDALREAVQKRKK